MVKTEFRKTLNTVTAINQALHDRVTSAALQLYISTFIKRFDSQNNELLENLVFPNNEAIKEYVFTLLETLKAELDKAVAALEYTNSILPVQYELFNYKTSHVDKPSWFYVLNKLSWFGVVTKDKVLNETELTDVFCNALYYYIHSIELVCWTHKPQLFPNPELMQMKSFMELTANKEAQLFLTHDQQVINACFQILINLEIIDKDYNYISSKKSILFRKELF